MKNDVLKFFDETLYLIKFNAFTDRYLFGKIKHRPSLFDDNTTQNVLKIYPFCYPNVDLENDN